MSELFVRSGGVWVPTDKVGKARINGADVPFAPAGSGLISFFQQEVPASRDQSDGVVYTMGTYLRSAAPWEIHGVRWYCTITRPIDLVFGLYMGPSGTLEKSFPLSALTLTLDAWNEFLFDAPFTVPANTNACPFVVTNRYCNHNASGYFASPVTRGFLTAPTSAGKFNGSPNPPNYPTSQFNNNCYFVDAIASQ